MNSLLSRLLPQQSPRKVSLILVCAVTLGVSLLARGQITITEINPNQSTLDVSDPDGASGGRVNGLAIDPGNGSIFYAASEWGGIYKSSDTGRTWARLNAHLPTVTWDIEVSPADSNRVIATSFYDGRVNSVAGINISTNGGMTWNRPASAVPPVGFCRFAARRDELSAYGISFDPANPRNVFVGTSCGLALSNDSGSTWRYLDPTAADPADDIWDVVVHHGGIIDLCGDDGHRRSTNGGTNWSTATPGGNPLPAGRCSIAASPDESHVLFAVSGTSIFETDNGGGSWNTQFVNPSRQGRIPFVATNQRVGNGFDLWFGDVSLFRAGCTTPANPAPGGAARCPASNAWAGPFTRSAGGHDDTGEILFSRPPRVTPPPVSDCLEQCREARDDCLNSRGPGGPTPAQCLQAFNRCRQRCSEPPPPSEGCPIMMSSDGGVYFNTRTASPACQTPLWEQPNVTPKGLWLFGMDGANIAGSAINEFLYFGLQDDGTFATGNAGAGLPTWNNRDCCDGFDMVADTTRVLYTMCCFGGQNFLFSRGAGLTGGGQVNAPPGGLAGFRFPDVVDRFGTNRYVAIGGNGIFISTTNAINWATQLGAQTTPANACGIQASGPSNNPTFIVQAGSCSGSTQDRLFRFVGTAPNGAWQQIARPGNVGGFGIFAVDPNAPNRILASHLTAGGPAMMITNNGGNNWNPIAGLDALMIGNGAFRSQNTRGPTNFTGFGGYAQPTLVAFDPNNANTLLAGGADSGIFLSRNGGNTWTTVTNNSGPPQNPHIPRPRFAYFDRECGSFNIYIGTQGRGVWRLRYPDPDTPSQQECLSVCNDERESCIATCCRPGSPTAAQCLQAFRQCEQRCRDCP